MPWNPHFLSSVGRFARQARRIYLLTEADGLAEVRLDALFADAKGAQIFMIGLAAVVQSVGNPLAGAKVVENV